MKKKIYELTQEERTKTLDALYTAAGTVRGRSAMKLFLRDLLTESERIMLGRRILIARLLLEGESYNDIVRRLGTSPTTIRVVQRWLQQQLPGYAKVIEDLNEEYEKRVERKLFATNTLYRLKKKYPLHFLLFPNPAKPK